MTVYEFKEKATIEAKKAALKICNRDCIASYPTCARCREPGDYGGVKPFPFLVGENTICPLARYEVPDQPPKLPFEMTASDRITLDECFFLCANCGYAKTAPEESWFTVNRGDNFLKICLDCPVHLIEDGLREQEAEAAMS